MESMFNILVCTDNNYIIPLAALLSSLRESLINEKIIIHWFALEVSNTNVEKILTLADSHTIKIKLYKFNNSNISSKFYTSGRITSATYLRLYVADKLRNISKILYLDCDMIILGSIKELWAYDISQQVAAVVEDDKNINLSHLGGAKPSKYFNAGMMLINMDQWKKNKIQDKLFQLLNKKIHFRFHDQDRLNLTLNKKIIFIEPRWNLIPSRENQNTIKYYSIISRLRLEKLFHLSCIIHYASSKKPWHYLSSHPLKFLWWKHLRRTEFSHFVPEDKNFFNFFFKICPKPLRFLLSK
jgi:lipopolysaccharide biosynthesis glycosyltransferase